MDRTDLDRRAWRARRAVWDTVGLGRRVAAGVAVAVGLALLATVGHAFLGRLGDPFTLLVVLAPFAMALSSFRLRDVLAVRIAAIASPEGRLVAAYLLWLATAAFLTVPVATAAVGSVAMAVGRDREERRWQLGAATLGVNLGGLLLPFSSVTTLILVVGSGIEVGDFIAAALPTLIGAAVAGGALLVARFEAARDADDDSTPAADDPPIRYGPARAGVGWRKDPGTPFAAGIAAAAALTAVVTTLTGGSPVWPFVGAAVILVAWAIAGGRLEPRSILDSVPVTLLAIVVVAALLDGPIGGLVGFLPKPHVGDPVTLAAVIVAGGALTSLVGGIPAAVVGAAWLTGAPAAIIVAWLLGASAAAFVFPRGSLVIVLADDLARRHAPPGALGTHVNGAWSYALIASVGGLACLALLRP